MKTMVKAFLFLALIVISFAGCGNDGGVDNESFLIRPGSNNENIPIRIDELDVYIDFVVERNIRYPKFWFTNNSNYTITNFSLVMRIELDELDEVDRENVRHWENEGDPYTDEEIEDMKVKRITADWFDDVKPGETSGKREL